MIQSPLKAAPQHFKQNHRRHDSLASCMSTCSHYFYVLPRGSTMGLWACEVLSRSGLNAKGSLDSSSDSTTLSRCFFCWAGMPLKGGCRVKGRRSKTKKKLVSGFSSHGTQRKYSLLLSSLVNTSALLSLDAGRLAVNVFSKLACPPQSLQSP